MAKRMMGLHVIDGSEGTSEYWLVETVRKLAEKAGVGMPEVGLYEGPANAFATGAFKDSALVAVSTGLLQSMSKEEVEAVLGHEMAHVANGDMVTLTLIQGVLNTFVFFLARVVGFIIDKAVFRTERGVGFGFYITVFVCQILFGIVASAIVAWFSRWREFRADRGSADLLGTPQPMIAALGRLGQVQTGGLPDAVKAFGISSESKMAQLFATHPPIEQRIAALRGS
jgi:heat shock protein HtpX